MKKNCAYTASFCKLGSLKNYVDDGNGSVKKRNRFNEPNNSARASRFFVHFFAVTVQLSREMTKF